MNSVLHLPLLPLTDLSGTNPYSKTGTHTRVHTALDSKPSDANTADSVRMLTHTREIEARVLKNPCRETLEKRIELF